MNSKKQPGLTFAQRIRRAKELVSRIQSSRPCDNDTFVVIAFAERGVPVDAIYPRETVLPFDAWLAYGRHVRKGEKSIAVPTWTPITRKDDQTGTRETVTRTDKTTGEEKAVLRQTAAYLFGIWQTDPNEAAHADYWTLSPMQQRALQLCASIPAAEVTTPEPAEELPPPADPLPLTIAYGSTVIHQTAAARPFETLPLFA